MRLFIISALTLIVTACSQGNGGYQPITNTIANPTSGPWSKNCSVDEMTDKRTCYVSYTHWFTSDDDKTSFLIVVAHKDGVSVSQKNLYPHRAVQLRVDEKVIPPLLAGVESRGF